jgi:flagellar export protein FliJ
VRSFSFSLDAALRLRRHAEEQAEVELAAKQRAVAAEQARVEELRRRLECFDLERAGRQDERVDVDALVDAERMRVALTQDLDAQVERFEAAKSAAEAALALLYQRRIEREALDRLRARRLAEYREQELRDEQQWLDEAAVVRWRGAGGL